MFYLVYFDYSIMIYFVSRRQFLFSVGLSDAKYFVTYFFLHLADYWSKLFINILVPQKGYSFLDYVKILFKCFKVDYVFGSLCKYKIIMISWHLFT